MAVTIKTIAEKAGVSVVTVSRALNNRHDISKEMREKILKIAEEFNYVPNHLAKSLVTRRTKTIGLIIKELVDSFLAEVVQGVSDVAREKGFTIILCHTYDNADQEIEYIRHLRAKQVDGMLIYPTQADKRYIHELKNSPIPYVFLNRHTDALRCDYVANDNIEGTYQLVNHLIQQGRKRIVYLCAKPSASSGHERILGCQKAIRENGLPSNYLRVESCDETIESCYNAAKMLIANYRHEIDAILSWDDRLSLGIIRALFEAGIRIPDDIAVAGYDDSEIAQHLSPPLTTIHQPAYQIGKIAAEILFEKIASEESAEAKQIILKPELIVRASTVRHEKFSSSNTDEELNLVGYKI